MATLAVGLNRGGRIPLSTQIYGSIRDAIESGQLAPGARLPSWSDLAAQLGVSRGTVRAAYERLIDEQLAIGLGAAGTRVAARPLPATTGWTPEASPLPDLFHDFSAAPLTFQMGVPAQDAFPFKLWSRIQVRAARRAAAAPVSYPDPRGDPDLRQEIAAYLGVSRGLRCSPCQQAPLGMTMSLARRISLLNWAKQHDAWIVEDDYLGELQLKGRAAPALASLDQDGRVLHIGTFSKTISPALRLGFVVVPLSVARRFGDVAVCLAPAPAASVQHAVTEFMHDGHYLRHLRRMKRLYAARQAALVRCLNDLASQSIRVQAAAGMTVVAALPQFISDIDIASRARLFGLAPVPLSPWYMSNPGQQGLLLGVTNLSEKTVAANCSRLLEIVLGRH